MTEDRTSGSGEPQQRLPRPRPGRRRYLALTVAVVAIVAIVASALSMARSIAGSDGVLPGEAVGYGTAPTSSAPASTTTDTTLPSVPAPVDDVPEPPVLPMPAAPAPTGDGPTVSVPTTSGRLDDIARSDRPLPTRLRIPALGVDAPINAVGYGDGEMEIPSTAGDVGWYEFGPGPGEDGSSVLAAHVSWNGRRGVFFDLVDLPSGGIIEVEFADGSVRRFESVALTTYGKPDLPVDDIFRRDGPPVLTLITCGGAFNPSLRSYEDNVVAYAVEITADPIR